MNGLELLKIVHAKFPDLPVVLFTAQPDLNSAVEAVRSGAVDYLLKPLKPQAVIDRTNSILEKNLVERRKRVIPRHRGFTSRVECARKRQRGGECYFGTETGHGVE